MNYQTKLLPKSTVQAMIKGLRSSGLKVKKIDGGYICKAVRRPKRTNNSV